MIELEQAGYPCISGRSGIAFESLGLIRTNNVKGESGSTLNYMARRNHIGVYDAICKGFRMVADVKEGDTVAFDLETRINGYRHCDMYAGKFQSFAIKNFEALGHSINYWVSDWEYWSDNYRQFHQALKSGLDVLSAARSTWTAQAAERNGFTLFRRSAVIDIDDHIAVVFTRSA